jgi:hypothetical protein
MADSRSQVTIHALGTVFVPGISIASMTDPHAREVSGTEVSNARCDSALRMTRNGNVSTKAPPWGTLGIATGLHSPAAAVCAGSRSDSNDNCVTPALACQWPPGLVRIDSPARRGESSRSVRQGNAYSTTFQRCRSKGRMLSIDEGKKTKRLVIGLGSWASEVRTLTQVYEVTSGDGRRLIEDFYTRPRPCGCRRRSRGGSDDRRTARGRVRGGGGAGRSGRSADGYFSLRMIGSPLLSPSTTIFAFGLLDRSCATSMAFHFRSSELMPRATMVWKSAMPCASTRLRSAS